MLHPVETPSQNSEPWLDRGSGQLGRPWKTPWLGERKNSVELCVAV